MQKLIWLTFRMLNKNEKNYKKPHININSQSENIAVASGHCMADLIINELLAESAAELLWRRIGPDDQDLYENRRFLDILITL